MPELHLARSDRIDFLKQYDDNTFDSAITDPPYAVTSKQPDVTEILMSWMNGQGTISGGTGIAGHKWDGAVPDPVFWAEVLRVVKPGGHVLAFAFPRTSDLASIAMRFAGLRILPHMVWIYASGMPKGQNLEKVIGQKHPEVDATQYRGVNTAIKPAHEVILWGQKPLEGTYAQNVIRWGTGGVNIDAARIGYETGGSTASNPSLRKSVAGGNGGHIFGHEPDRRHMTPSPEGRWPSSVLLGHSESCVQVGSREIKTDTHYPSQRGAGGVTTDGHRGQIGLFERTPGTETQEVWECDPGCPITILDSQTGVLKSGTPATRQESAGKSRRVYGMDTRPQGTLMVGYGDTGGPSRFFYCGKASQSERNTGLDGQNPHPTPKPVGLLRQLTRLVTPPGGTVLDPHFGSGSGAVAAIMEGRGFVGCDLDEEEIYLPIAKARVAHALGQITSGF